MSALKRFVESGGKLPSPPKPAKSPVELAADKAVEIKKRNPGMGYPLAAERVATHQISSQAILSELGRRGGNKRAITR